MADAAPNTWDVELPDGTTVQDIPAGTTKAQLADKLSKNGYHVPDEWMGAKPGPDTPAYSAEGLPKPMPAWQGVGKELSGVADQLGLTPLIQSLQAPGQSHAQRLRAAMARQGPLPGQPTPGETYADMGRGVVGGLADIAGTPAAALNALWSPEGGIPGLMAHAGPQALKQDIGAIAQPQTSAGRTIEAGTNLVAPMAIPPVARGLASVATPTGWRAAEARMAAREAAAGLPAAGTGSTPPPMPPRPGVPPAPSGAAPGSFGADTASAARASRITDQTHPQLAAAANAAGANLNARAFDAHERAIRVGGVDAQGQPLIRLTPGEATGNPTMQREEYDNANDIGGLRDQKAANVEILRRRLSDPTNPEGGIREQLAEEAAAPGHTMEALIAENERNEAARTQAIGEAYDRLQAISGDFPVDLNAVVRNADAALRREWSTTTSPHGTPLPQLEQLRQVAASGGKITMPDGTIRPFDASDYTALGRSLAQTMRGTDAAAAQAAGIMRTELEALPLMEGRGAGVTAEVKAAADEARGLARDRLRRLNPKDEMYDPAYAAVVNGKANPGTFANFLSTPRGVARQLDTLGNTPEAAQNIAAEHIDQLTRAAKLGEDQTGLLGANALATAIHRLEPALAESLGQHGLEAVRDVQGVARDITPVPGKFGGNAPGSGNRVVSWLRGRMGAAASHLPYGIGQGFGAAQAFQEQQALSQLTARTMRPLGGLDVPEAPVQRGQGVAPLRARGEQPLRPPISAPGGGPPPPPRPPPPPPPPGATDGAFRFGGPGTPPPPPPPPGGGPRPPPAPSGGPPLPSLAQNPTVQQAMAGLRQTADERASTTQRLRPLGTRSSRVALGPQGQTIFRDAPSTPAAAPAAAPVAPPVASRSGPPPAPSIHQAALGRVTSLQGEILDALANPGLGEAGAKPLRENMATLRAHLTNAGVSAQDIQRAVEAGKPSGRALIETHEADPAETARQEEAMRQMNEEMKAEEERLKRLRPPKPGTQYNSARPFDINSLKPRK